mgnify:FL=1
MTEITTMTTQWQDKDNSAHNLTSSTTLVTVTSSCSSNSAAFSSSLARSGGGVGFLFNSGPSETRMKTKHYRISSINDLLALQIQP